MEVRDPLLLCWGCYQDWEAEEWKADLGGNDSSDPDSDSDLISDSELNSEGRDQCSMFNLKEIDTQNNRTRHWAVCHSRRIFKEKALS